MAGSAITVTSPVDGRSVGVVPDHDAHEVADVLAELAQRQPAWERSGFGERAAWLRRYRDWLLDHADELAEILQAETGKPWVEANLEVPYVVDVINYYTKHGENFLAEERPRNHGLMTAPKRQLLVRRPYQLVGVISPWNFPLGLALIDVVPALLAGAAVVAKPSEFTPLSSLRAAQGWAEIGAPPVFASVTGRGATGAAVVDGVDYVQFTGSTRTGRAIAHVAAERLIPCGLELGGKDAMIVLDDADLVRAANAAVWGGMANAGQMCTSVERVYVEASVYEEFVTLVADRVRALRVGEEKRDFGFDVGPLANSAQADIVGSHVADAIDKGAKAVVGGAVDGNFAEPTVLVDVDHTMVCMQEETFGPTLPIMKVAHEHEAVSWANDSPYGLSATVFSGDPARAERIARQLDAGGVNINDVFGNLFTLPLAQSGWKTSGLGGRNGGAYGITKYTQGQAIVTARVTPRNELIWYPYTKLRYSLVRRAGRLLGAADLRRKLG